MYFLLSGFVLITTRKSEIAGGSALRLVVDSCGASSPLGWFFTCVSKALRLSRRMLRRRLGCECVCVCVCFQGAGTVVILCYHLRSKRLTAPAACSMSVWTWIERRESGERGSLERQQLQRQRRLCFSASRYCDLAFSLRQVKGVDCACGL